MSDDRKDEEITKPQPSDSAPENLPPFVDDSANFVALSSRALMAGRGALTANAEVFPPLLAKTVRYVDFGFTTVREYWAEVAEPAYQRFLNDETRGNAIAACLALWPLHDWLWHEQNPGEDTRKRKKDYDQFRQQFFNNCPELAWLRDVADAGKHRGLGRSDVQVREVAKTWPRNTLPLKIMLDDGSEHNITDVLRRIVEYFRKTHFPI
ncbi:MAG: hypothetical protein WA840_22360 [Caulobacteraceae bacterium]